MLATCFFLSIPLKPIDFPERPLAKEIDAGVRIYRQGKGLERLYLDDRSVVGVWFDGKVKRDVDTVLWLSPSLVSRWLGFLEAKEKWPDGELEHRWSDLRMELGGQMTFVARLCSMPRIDALEGEIDSDANPVDSREVRFLFTSSQPEKASPPFRDNLLGFVIPPAASTGSRVLDGAHVDPKICLLSDCQAHSASEVLREDWWMRVPFGAPLQPEFSSKPCAEDYPLGEFYASTYLVRLPIPEAKLPANRFELRVFSPHKERIARFSTLVHRSR